ncbi:hypothetical protein NEF87_004898 [Candidatus Lokiarchaeum ossiferum]|uniref:Nucleoside 2-deoxyribosyltransferase n=1 Tax=Candidatus Lokiarchaeum ossiferum TaxID=2951803 RepID=A0ABY6HYK1_9ARCH|nr:hypothetical protein NEF87_004898 [Candidatus Lokiarchaeum sp. B-35]
MKNQFVEITLNEINDFVFAIHPFKEPYLKNFKELIKPTFEKKGFTCDNVGEKKGPINIKKEIWKLTRTAKIIIADISDLNPNVFYELGLAHALGKPVIIIIDSKTKNPFDVNSIKAIEYNTSEKRWKNKLKIEISEYIDAIIQENQFHIYDNISVNIKDVAKLGDIQERIQKISKIHPLDLLPDDLKSKELSPIEIALNRFSQYSEQEKKKKEKVLQIQAKRIYDDLQKILFSNDQNIDDSKYSLVFNEITPLVTKLGFIFDTEFISDDDYISFFNIDNKYILKRSGVHYLSNKEDIDKRQFLKDLKDYWKEKIELDIS